MVVTGRGDESASLPGCLLPLPSPRPGSGGVECLALAASVAKDCAELDSRSCKPAKATTGQKETRGGPCRTAAEPGSRKGWTGLKALGKGFCSGGQIQT